MQPKNKKMKFIVLVSTIFCFLFSFSVCLADDSLVPQPTGKNLPKGLETKCKPGAENCGNYTLDDFVRTFVLFANYALAVVGAFALLFFIYGGLVFLTSGGSQEQVTKGRSILINSVIGLLIVFGSALLIQLTYKSLGLKWSEKIEPGMPELITPSP